jgi:hypothetical protein
MRGYTFVRMRFVKRGEIIMIYPNQEGYTDGTELSTCAEARNAPAQIVFSPSISIIWD